MNVQYSEKVLDHFMHPRNVGKFDDADITATDGSPACGDQVTIQLKVNKETSVIEDIRFQSYGCASNIATASIVTEMAKGKTLEEAKDIHWKEAAKELDGLPPVKMHCSVLAVDTLQKAIKEYEIANNLREREVFSKESIVEELKHIIYPQVGEDIVTLKMVKYVGLEGSKAIVDIDIPKFDEHRNTVKEEIIEHLEKYPEISEIEVNM
jgi:nitrogen fixation NifU-like protein